MYRSILGKKSSIETNESSLRDLIAKLIVRLPSENIYYFAVDLVPVMEETMSRKLVRVIPK
jgi:hypothetical protein